MDFNNYFENVIKNLANDNSMPFVKTEVVYDTFLYPEVLLKLLQTAEVEAEYITKEFPIDNKDLGLGTGYISIDYLLVNHKKEEFYIVELKTTNGSFDYRQLRRYAIAMERFYSILERYVKEKYAKDGAYEKQRNAVKTALLINSSAEDISKYERYKVNLIYIIPGFSGYIDVKEKVKAAISGTHTKDVQFYKNLDNKLKEKNVVTISINKLLDGKIVFKEEDSLDQFLYIWHETMASK